MLHAPSCPAASGAWHLLLSPHHLHHVVLTLPDTQDSRQTHSLPFQILGSLGYRPVPELMQAPLPATASFLSGLSTWLTCLESASYSQVFPPTDPSSEMGLLF